MLDYNPGLDIFIASRDRPAETLRAICALKLVDFGVPTRIVVSDNASSAEKVLENLPTDVIHIVRNSCDAQAHINLIFNELNCQWFLLTHDDDEILPPLGNVFRDALIDPDVNIVSGRSTIIGQSGTEVIDPSYEQRLLAANLVDDGNKSLKNFNQLLFDYGTLLPASSIIMKTSLIRKGFQLNPDTNYAGDFEYSLAISRDSVVRYCGSDPVMKYHLHGGNSVFNSDLPFVLPSQTLICRLTELMISPGLLSQSRLNRLKIDLKRATLLAYEARETTQLERVLGYVQDFENTFNVRISTPLIYFLFKSRKVALPLQLALRFRRRFFVKHSNTGI